MENETEIVRTPLAEDSSNETFAHITATGQASAPTGRMPLSQLVPLMVAVSLGYFAVQLDVSIVNLSLPAIQASYHADVAALQWIVNAYTLSFSVLLLSAGILGDRYGNRRFLIIGYALFLTGSLACALAPTISTMQAARFFQGFGAAFIVPNSLAVINGSFVDDKRLRLVLLSVWMSFGGAALTCGPILGGVITSFTNWRYIFIINLPVCLLGMAITARAVKAAPQRPTRRQDWIGQALILLFSAALLFLIINYADMRSVAHAALLAVAAAGLAVFVVVELRLTDPAIPLDMFRNLGLQRAVTLGSLINFIYFGIVFYSSLYFRYDLKMTALQAGLAFIPMTLPLVFSNMLSARISTGHGPDRSISVGLAFLIPGMVWLALPAVDGGYSEMLPAFVVVSLGIGFITPMITSLALLSVDPERSGMISAVVNFFRQISGAFGVAVFGAFMASGGIARSYREFRFALAILAFALVASIGLFSRLGSSKASGAEG